MADARLCSIEDCGKPHYARGWCKAHYMRWWSHGNPLAGRAFNGDLPRYLNEVVLAYEGDDCLIWPYARDDYGYGKIQVSGRPRYVHRIVCETVHGPAPTPDYEAAHSCGKGHLGCCAKHHLSWKTPAENSADMFEHGTVPLGERNKMSKLTESDVMEIRSLRGLQSQRILARRFGVSQSLISIIQSGKVWSWLC